MGEEKKSVVDCITQGIINDIIEGKIRPGDRLPTEPELSAQYQAGRNSVREAIKKLEANGIVYIKRAEGTFVSEQYSHKMLDPMLYSIILEQNSWKDFVELRSVIDIGTLQVIISKAGPEDSFKDLRRLLLQMESALYEDAVSVEEILELDTRFHAAIAARTNNPQLVTITDYITRLTIPSRKKAVWEVLERGEEQNFIALHRQMLDVIEGRKSQDVIQTVLDHYVYWK